LRAVGHTVHTSDLYNRRTFETSEDGSPYSETLGGPMDDSREYNFVARR
jgi:hypothetical protein